MKRIIVCVLGVLLLLSTTSFAFLYELDILDKAAIEKLKNQQLLDLYVDVLVEFEATETFYNRAGLTPKEFDKFKKLLRYRYDLRQEIEKRELDVPSLKL